MSFAPAQVRTSKMTVAEERAPCKNATFSKSYAMTLPVPIDAKREIYAPLVALLRDTLIKPKDLAKRWGFDIGHLANLRRAGHGLPYVQLPTGKKKAIRYRLSDIVLAELAGTTGAVTLGRVCTVIAAMNDLTESQRKAIIARLENALG